MFAKSHGPSVEYHGSERTTQSCLDAISRMLAAQIWLQRAVLLTCDQKHAFFLDVANSHPVFIRSGFTSGYPGEGPAGLGKAILMFRRFNVEVEELLVSESLLDRINRGGVTYPDVDLISQGHFVRPIRTYDYVHFGLSGRGDHEAAIKAQFPPSIPWFALDDRLVDLAVMLTADPDKAVFEAFRRLESTVVRRCGFPVGTAGIDVFQKAFRGSGAILGWPGASATEAEGRAMLFVAAFQAYRNPRAHRDVQHDLVRTYREFYLINELFQLEREAEQRS